MFLVTIAFSIYVLILGPGQRYGFGSYRLINAAVFCIILFVLLVALTCFVCIIQLGLDQMPDASSSSITSFIAWFVFGISACALVDGMEILESIIMLLKDNCFGLIDDPISSIQLYSLCAALFASLILVLDFLFAQSWLIIEPNPPKSFKTIYKRFSTLLPSTKLPSIAVLSHTGRKTYLQEWTWESRDTVDHSLQSKLKM